MASTPFTPSRSALGDISNRKLFKSTFKTPAATAQEIEKIYGEAQLPEVLELDMHDLEVYTSPSQSPKHYCIENLEISIDSYDYSDPEFEPIDEEINSFLDLGITYNNEKVSH
jgi:hypothetical protein